VKHFNYYSEWDQGAAAWLRELMADGLIAPGAIDTRSITDVQPEDLRGFTQHHFFCGIAGWPLALDLAGWGRERPVWTGSPPCQGFSVAGRGQGFDDPRHLWPAFFRLIRECRPDALFGEQVTAAIGHGWLDLVHDDLESIGYACGATSLPAGALAPHKRDRLWFYARPFANGEQRRAVTQLGVGHGADAERGPAERHRLALGDEARGVQGASHERQRFWHDARHGSDDGQGARAELGVADTDCRDAAQINARPDAVHEQRPAQWRGPEQWSGSGAGGGTGDGPHSSGNASDLGNLVGEGLALADGNGSRLDGGPALSDGQRAALGNHADGCREERGVGLADATLERHEWAGGARRRGTGSADGGELEHADCSRGTIGLPESAQREAGITGITDNRDGEQHCTGNRSASQELSNEYNKRGPWNDCAWIACRDPRAAGGIVWRPVEWVPAEVADGLPPELGYCVLPDSSIVLWPLIESGRAPARKVRLQGYGNAICPPLAAIFIEAAMDLEKEEQG